jgi:hypothetical protein
MKLSFLLTSKASSVRQELKCLVPAVSLFKPDRCLLAFLTFGLLRKYWTVWFTTCLCGSRIVMPSLLGDLVNREQKLSAVDERVSSVYCLDTSAFAMARAH